MELVGKLYTEGGGGEVYKENGVFFDLVQNPSIYLAEVDDNVVVDHTPIRGKDYSSLEALVADLPKGVCFVGVNDDKDVVIREWVNEIMREYLSSKRPR